MYVCIYIYIYTLVGSELAYARSPEPSSGAEHTDRRLEVTKDVTYPATRRVFGKIKLLCEIWLKPCGSDEVRIGTPVLLAAPPRPVPNARCGLLAGVKVPSMDSAAPPRAVRPPAAPRPGPGPGGPGAGGQDLLMRLRERRVPPGELDEVVSSLRASGKLANPKASTIVIGAYGRQGRWRDAGGILGELRSRRQEPGVITYNAALSACARAGEWPAALHLLEEMRAARQAPDVISCSAAIPQTILSYNMRYYIYIYTHIHINI